MILILSSVCIHRAPQITKPAILFNSYLNQFHWLLHKPRYAFLYSGSELEAERSCLGSWTGAPGVGGNILQFPSCNAYINNFFFRVLHVATGNEIFIAVNWHAQHISWMRLYSEDYLIKKEVGPRTIKRNLYINLCWLWILLIIRKLRVMTQNNKQLLLALMPTFKFLVITNTRKVQFSWIDEFYTEITFTRLVYIRHTLDKYIFRPFLHVEY